VFAALSRLSDTRATSYRACYASRVVLTLMQWTRMKLQSSGVRRRGEGCGRDEVTEDDGTSLQSFRERPEGPLYPGAV
jgi:hypothetical protein